MTFFQIAAFLNASILGYVGYFIIEMTRYYENLKLAEAAAAAARITRTQPLRPTPVIATSAAGAEYLGLIVFVLSLMGAIFWVAAKNARQQKNLMLECSDVEDEAKTTPQPKHLNAIARTVFWALVIIPAILGMLLAANERPHATRSMDVNHRPYLLSSILDDLVAPKMLAHNQGDAHPQTSIIVRTHWSFLNASKIAQPEEITQRKRFASIAPFKISFHQPVHSTGPAHPRNRAVSQPTLAARPTHMPSIDSMTELRSTILPRRRGLNLGLKLSTDNSERATVTRSARSNSLP